MPNLENIPKVLYSGDDPYHFYYDNLPLKNILTRINLVNSQVDINADEIRASLGTAGSLAGRLDVSLDSDGSLLSSAVDDAAHSIAYHEDGSRNDGPGGATVEYVRMKQDERDKLASIGNEANKLVIRINDGTVTDLSSGIAELVESDSVTWKFVSPNKIEAITKFPANAARLHYYSVTPEPQDSGTPDYKSYQTPLAQSYVDGSLRVFVNGIRVSDGTYVYLDADPSSAWFLVEVDAYDASAGTFVLSRAITASDVIRIDYDVNPT